MNMNSTPPSSRAALRRLLVVLAITLGVVIYSYGWTMTDIDLAKPQQESRQESVQNALRELLSPRIFEQDREVVTLSTSFLMDCEAGEAPEAPAPSDEAYVTISPTCGSPGDLVTIEAHNFSPNAEARIRWAPQEGQRRPREVVETGREDIVLSSSGGFEGHIEVPRIAGSTGEIHRVEFLAAVPSGPVRFSSITTEVIKRMAETIFMALVATSLSIPASVILSFFAAHNLMRPVRMPAGEAMLAMIMLPVGWIIGQEALGVIGQIGVNLPQRKLLEGVAFIPGIVGMAVASRRLSPLPVTSFSDRVRSTLNQLAFAIAAIFALGLLGGLALLLSDGFIELGDSFRPSDSSGLDGWLITAFADGIAGIGTFLDIIGGLIDLFIVPIGGFVGALTLSSVAGNLSRDALRTLPQTTGYILGGVLGIFSGAVLLAICALIGTSAALMGLITPFIAGLMGRYIVARLYDMVRPVRGQSEDNLRMVLSLVGLVIAFAFTFWLMNIDRSIIDGTLPTEDKTDIFGIEISTYIANAILIGGVLGGIAGALTGTNAPFLIGDVLYNITRTTLNALRSIEPLIMGLIFVIWVGIGPFAGVLALTLHSIASLGKLYSEQIETIDPGPIEALKATGARHIQTIIYAVVPQIIPPYIAFTMYRWDINVRMSTIIGFVGGGGIGLLLSQQINLLRYRDAGVAVLAIAIVVSILDYASASIREHVG